MCRIVSLPKTVGAEQGSAKLFCKGMCLFVVPLASVAGNVNVFERANNENCEKDYSSMYAGGVLPGCFWMQQEG